MSYEVKNLEGKRRKINRISVDDDDVIQICEEPNVKKIIQCGIIKRIILKNVFCHEHLDIETFIPHLNLLQGANGSGKSSVVAGIIVGLGGTCKATERGSNISSIIKNGKNSACIEIHLSNDGFNSYHQEKYGNKIIVERKLTSSGSSSYKIKSEQGGIVSNKREDLNKILEKFNIQVNNPGLILSQERAKTFLSSTDPKHLFKFFMTSTQLKQWSDCITDISTDLDTQKSLIARKNESLTYLKKDIEVSKKKIEAMNSLEDNRIKLKNLIFEKDWAEVQENEMKQQNLKDSYKKTSKELETAKKKTVEATEKLKELKVQKKTNEAKIEHLLEQSKSFDTEKQNADASVCEANKILRQRNNQKLHLQKQKIDFEKDVAILREKLQNDSSNVARDRWEQSRKELACEIEKYQQDFHNIEEKIKTEETQFGNIDESVRAAEKEIGSTTVEREGLNSYLEQLKKEAKDLEHQKENVMVFGSYMRNLLNEINRTRFKIEKPIGPLGSYIKVKDKYKEWGHIVENVLFGVLSSFLVFSSDDFQLLKKIFDRIIPQGTRKPRIIISPLRESVHDVSRFETRTDQYCSVWSIIETNSIQVSNALLDQCQIESLLLVPDVDDAMYLMRESSRVPRNCKKVMTLEGDTVFPDPQFRIYSGQVRDRSVKFLQVSVKERIKDLTDNITATRREVQSCMEEAEKKRSNCEKLKMKKHESENKIRNLREERRKCLSNIEYLKNNDIPAPPDVCQLQNDLKEYEKRIEDINIKISEIHSLTIEATNKAKEAETRLKQVKGDIEGITSETLSCKKNGMSIGQLFTTRSTEIKRYNEIIIKLSEEEEELKASIEASKEAIDRLIKELHKNGQTEKIIVDKSKEEIEKELKNLKSAIEKQQSTLGDIHTLQESTNKKVKFCSQLKNELASQEKYINEMRTSINKRTSALRLAKKVYKGTMKHSFTQYITKRNLKGLMDINYKDETLKILIVKDTGSRSQELKSMQMLSGGERSFATVSFILALWEIVISPIRIMDEFDVFMDIVSRKQCFDMITESVKEQVQYIMVSPLECPIESAKVRILRLDPPERRSIGRTQESEDDE